MKYEDEKNNNENEELEDEEQEEQEEQEEEKKDYSFFKKKDSNNEELDNALKEKEELLTRFKRLQADFLNYKKRVEKEKDSLVNYGIETLTVDILPVLDNFERALEAEVDKDNEDDSFFQGIEMIYDSLVGVLNKNDIKEMESLEEPFDPEYHHAVAMEASEEYEENTVIKILQKGYIMKDKVIRPSMVIVSK